MGFNRRDFIKKSLGAALAAHPLTSFAANQSELPGNRADLVFEVGRRTQPLIAIDAWKEVFFASLTKMQVAAIAFDLAEDGVLDLEQDKFDILIKF